MISRMQRTGGHGLRSQRSQRWLSLATVIALAIAASLSLRSLPDLERLRLAPLAAVALFGVPLTTLLNSTEYILAGRMLHIRVGIREAVRVSLQGTAANLLPVPGAAVVRMKYLVDDGGSLVRSSLATLVVGITWFGVSLLMAGVVVLSRNPTIGVPILLAGAVVLVVGGVVLRRAASESRTVLGAMLLLVEVSAVAVQGLRYLLVLAALSIDASISQTLALAVSVAAGAALGILPGGLGLREAVAGAIAPLVGLNASAGLLAAVVDRVVGLLILVPMAAATAVGLRRRGSAS